MKQYIVICLCLIALVSCKNESQNLRLSGPVFGTSYDVVYYSESGELFQKELDSLFYTINKSMSNYQVNSDISKLNRGEQNSVDEHFENVFQASKQVYKSTDGLFDPTIGKLVNAWNFGAETNKMALDSLKIDSLMQYVGFDKVQLQHKKIIKTVPQLYIDFNAVAKGYAVDVVGRFLESKNVEHYLVNIGGELRARGQNIVKQSGWTVGIDNPNFDGSQSYDKVIVLNDGAMATSGTYRKFKLDEQGKRYAHIIDAKTGYPAKTNILSVSVLAETCMMADAYATAFQAMGIAGITTFLSAHPELKVYIIFENDKDALETLALNNFPVEE